MALENQQITTYVARQAFGVTAYPFDRFTRIEFGAGFNNIDRSRWFVTRKVFDGSSAGGYDVDSTHRDPSLNYFDGQMALVSDNTLFGYTGPDHGPALPLSGEPRGWLVRLDPVSRRLPALRSDHLQLSHDRDPRLRGPVDRHGRDGVPEVHRAARLRARLRSQQQRST